MESVDSESDNSSEVHDRQIFDALTEHERSTDELIDLLRQRQIEFAADLGQIESEPAIRLLQRLLPQIQECIKVASYGGKLRPIKTAGYAERPDFIKALCMAANATGLTLSGEYNFGNPKKRSFQVAPGSSAKEISNSL